MKPFKVESHYTFIVKYNKEKFCWREAREYKVTEIICDTWRLYRDGGVDVRVLALDGVLQVTGNKKGKTAEAAMYALERFRKFPNWEEVK